MTHCTLTPWPGGAWRGARWVRSVRHAAPLYIAAVPLMMTGLLEKDERFGAGEINIHWQIIRRTWFPRAGAVKSCWRPSQERLFRSKGAFWGNVGKEALETWKALEEKGSEAMIQATWLKEHDPYLNVAQKWSKCLMMYFTPQDEFRHEFWNPIGQKVILEQKVRWFWCVFVRMVTAHTQEVKFFTSMLFSMFDLLALPSLTSSTILPPD